LWDSISNQERKKSRHEIDPAVVPGIPKSIVDKLKNIFIFISEIFELEPSTGSFVLHWERIIDGLIVLRCRLKEQVFKECVVVL
jgi:hypothetical protein